MNTDYKKPPLAPKPKLMSQSKLELSSSFMSRPCFSARGPKPPIAPKPLVPQSLEERDSPCCNHTQDGCSNGSLGSSEEEPEQDNEPEDSVSGGEARRSWGEGLDEQEGPEGPQFDSYPPTSGTNLLENGSEEQEEEVEERERVEEMTREEEEEDWRVTVSALTEEADPMYTHGISDTGSTIDSVDAVEMIDSDITDDMDAEGCDAGEALADTDGLSVGELSVTSVEEEEAACHPCETVPGREEGGMEEEEKIQRKEEEAEAADGTADAVTESLPEGPSPKPDRPANVLQLDVEDDEKDLDSGAEENMEIPPNLSDDLGSQEDKAEGNQLCSVINGESVRRPHCLPEDERRGGGHGARASEVDPPLRPYEVSSRDIADGEQSPADRKPHGPSARAVPPQDSPSVSAAVASPSEYAAIGDDGSLGGDSEDMGQIECVSSEDYVEIGDDDEGEGDSGESTRGQRRKSASIESEEHGAEIAEALRSPGNGRPRFRLVSVTAPVDLDSSSAASSFSDGQLLSPDSSGMFRDEDDLEGHIVPYLDETTDTEQDLSDEHVYEEAGLDSEGENFLPFDRKSMVMRSRSLSGKVPETVPEEAGSEFRLQKYCMLGGERTGPLLSSSPMLSAARAKSSARPQRFVLYPRSFSMEGRDAPLCVYREGGRTFPGGRSHTERGQEDSLSLPCVIGSSGSFSQHSPLPASGLSTPTSVVDIPPPFQLAYITKKPITKSSPSLLIEGDSPDRNKKKKSSFKRFLMLKFRRKTESKLLADVNPSSSSFRSSSESGRALDSDRRSAGSSRPISKPLCSPDSPSTFLFYKDGRRKGGSVAFASRNVARVESFEERSRAPFTPLPLTKPRSISFPNVDTSDYENIPVISSDYENIQIPSRRPVRTGTFAEFFDHPSRVLSSASETDGYVDMSSFHGFECKAQSAEQETESAYTEAYSVCSMAVGPPLEGEAGGGAAGEEEHGRTSEEEEVGAESSYDRQTDGRSRAFYIAKELVDTERLHVKALKLLQEDFREAVGAAVGEEGEPVLEEERLKEILNELPDVYTLHRRILTELENRLRQWEESQRIADVILSRRSEFVIFTTYIGHYDRSMSLLDESCRSCPAFADIVHRFEQSPVGENISLKHQLLQVIVHVAQYRMLLTDYLNNLSPDSKEYEDTQAAIVIVSDIADQANDSLKHGENLLRLVNIEYSVRGQKGLLQPGRVFVKEGTLMKISRKCRQPRHLFLMNDVLLYTYPQQDGKYRLKNTLSLTGMKVSKPVVEKELNALRIEAADISITLSASSCSERDDWFYTLSRTVADHARGPAPFNCSGEARERVWLSLGEKAPTLVPVSQVMMCMNCTSDFSLALRRHHCHACGRIVCRSCSRNRFPLKYLKDRMAKVCDHCYSELKKRGGDASVTSGSDKRSSRPLSAVFQNLHPPSLWRQRKGAASLNQVSVSEEGSISGTLQRSKRTKRNWKRLWFLLKDKVLYTYRAREEKVASESLPLLGFTVKLPARPEGEQQANVFQLYHKKTLYYTFKAEDNHTAKRWVNAMEEATVL